MLSLELLWQQRIKPMTDLISKITSYNIFNNLVPGVVFSYSLSVLGIAVIKTDNLATDLLLFYFIGVVVSRFGSIFVEPIFRVVKLVKHSNYDDYINASNSDQKLEILLESNNQYRTYIGLIALVLIAELSKRLVLTYQINDAILKIAVPAVCLVILSIAYKKQSSYIEKRVTYYTVKKRGVEID